MTVPLTARAPNSEINKLARGGFLGIVGLTISAAFGFLFLRLIGGVTSPSSTGAIFIALSVFSVLAFIAPMGADIGFQRFMPIYRITSPRREKQLCSTGLIPPILISVLLVAIVLAFAPNIASVAVRHGNRHLMADQLALTIPFLPFSTVMITALAGLRGWSIVPTVIVQNIAVPSSRVILLLVFAHTGVRPPLSTALSWGSPLVIAAIISVAFLMKRVSNEVSGSSTVSSESPPKVFWSFWRFSAPRSIQAIFQILVVYLDVILVGALASTRSAAIYNVASRYATLGTTASQGVAYALGPQISRLIHAGNTAESQRVYQMGTAWIVILAWPVLLILETCAPLFMRIFGHVYLQGSVALVILCFAMLCQSVTGNNAVALNMAGKSTINLVIGIIALSTNVLANVLLIPRMGMNGAALAWLITIGITQTLTSWALYRTTRLHPFTSSLIVSALAALVSFGGVVLIVGYTLGIGFQTMGYAVVGGSILYVIILYWTRSLFSVQDLPMFLRKR